MAVVSGGNGGGRLNPWAEPFVPSGVRYRGLQTAEAEAEAEQEVEDFSPEWWRLVAASPAFRDCWLRDYGALGLLDVADDLDDDTEVDSFLPDDLFSPPPLHRDGEREEGAAGKRGVSLEVAAWGIDKWWRAHGSPPEAPRYAEKAPRKVAGGARVSPRPIQQPR
ncbi:protein EARLY RESPONSIVE TO DEHYDRATION 15-like [Phragmites australis]|uniref:protein EARLY RESPONSIVE TO DEHYDRATION 15-like n=1 Tax=Phragmites australis TaxID=29695 RepID=UPI002D76FDC7|nr:protein EARLY RESPONSIVE TO DEHYDRATION 15-like [Phragmites australis]